MTYFLFGVISGFAGFLFSPQYRIGGASQGDLQFILEWAVILGLFLSGSSHINGHGANMFNRSRVDYAVNLFISSVVGCLFSLIVFYFIRYCFLGRWVIIISVVTYCLLVFCYNIFIYNYRSDRIWMIGPEANHLCNVVRDLGGGHSSAGYSFDQCEFNVDEIQGSLSRNSIVGSYYVVVDSKPDFFSLADIKKWGPDLAKNIFSSESVIESEFEVISPKSFKKMGWWELRAGTRSSSYVVVKRWIDVLFSLFLLIFAAPVLILSAIAIKIADGGPIFYRQIRLGQYGQPFWILKLRTMAVDSEKDGAKWAAQRDSRVTFFGRILRKSRIDELPQIWNILADEMSLIGPRPERPEMYAVIENELPEFGLRLCAKPGLTGWAQVNYPYGASIHDSKVKLMYDAYYIKYAGIIMDLRIISRTVVAMVKGAR